MKEAAGAAAAAAAATPAQRRLQRRRARQQLCFLSPPPLAPYLACLVAEEDGGAPPALWEGGSGGLRDIEPALAAGLEAHCVTSKQKLARRCGQGIARLRELIESRRSGGSGPGMGDAAHG